MFRFQGSVQTYPSHLYPGALYMKEKHCQTKGLSSSVRVHLHSLRSLSEAERVLFLLVIEKLVSLSWHCDSWRVERNRFITWMIQCTAFETSTMSLKPRNHCHAHPFSDRFSQPLCLSPVAVDLRLRESGRQRFSNFLFVISTCLSCKHLKQI